ncbi:MAG: DUF2905 domain-containing protein [Hyphomicrobium sp.]
MFTLLITAFIVAVTLSAIGYVAGRGRNNERSPGPAEKPPVYALLPGDIKYESPSGHFRFYFPVTTSIILSIVLTVLLRLFS